MRKKHLIFLCTMLFCLAFLAGCKPSIFTYPNGNGSGTGTPLEVPYTYDEETGHITGIPYDTLIEATTPQGTLFAAADFGLDAANTNNASFLNNAIAAANDAGGGTVLLPASGVFKTGTVFLKSNVTLFIPKGCTLLSLDYAENKAAQTPLHQGLVYAAGANNVCIEGGGRIAGAGVSYTEEAKTEEIFAPMDNFKLKKYVLEHRKRIRFEKKNSGRVNLIHIIDSENIVIRNMELFESATWTVNLRDSKRITICNTVIDNQIHVANTDGIDLVGCQNVMLYNNFIAGGDDGICIKSNTKSDVSDIEISNCTVFSLANNFKIGTETVRDITRVSLKDCLFFKPANMSGGYAGIAIESADGAHVSAVRIENIHMQNIASPFLLWLGARLEQGTEATEPGSVSDILIQDIVAIDTELPSAVTGCKHNGKTYAVQDVQIKHVYAAYREAKETLKIKNPPKETSLTGYPEITRVSHNYFIHFNLSSFWDLPVYGYYERHAERTTLTDVTVVPRAANTRHSGLPLN